MRGATPVAPDRRGLPLVLTCLHDECVQPSPLSILSLTRSPLEFDIGELDDICAFFHYYDQHLQKFVFRLSANSNGSASVSHASSPRPEAFRASSFSRHIMPCINLDGEQLWLDAESIGWYGTAVSNLRSLSQLACTPRGHPHAIKPAEKRRESIFRY